MVFKCGQVKILLDPFKSNNCARPRLHSRRLTPVAAHPKSFPDRFPPPSAKMGV
jgi:hypothetical protein